MKRALKVLSEREVTPQLGLLKSTLLQLDSTFSEREYGASSFRDFMEKVAQTGAVTLKHAGRSMLVESREDGSAEVGWSCSRRQPAAAPAAAAAPVAPPVADVAACDARARPPTTTATRTKRCRASPMSMQDGIRAVQQAFARPPRRRAGRCTCGRPSSSCAPRSTASTSASTASRRSSICCAPPARKACCGSSAIARAPCACSRARTSTPKTVADAAGRSSTSRMTIAELDVDGDACRASRCRAPIVDADVGARSSRGRAGQPRPPIVEARGRRTRATTTSREATTSNGSRGATSRRRRRSRRKAARPRSRPSAPSRRRTPRRDVASAVHDALDVPAARRPLDAPHGGIVLPGCRT